MYVVEVRVQRMGVEGQLLLTILAAEAAVKSVSVRAQIDDPLEAAYVRVEREDGQYDLVMLPSWTRWQDVNVSVTYREPDQG